VIPIAITAKGKEEALGDIEQRIDTPSAELEQENAVGWILGEPVGQHTQPPPPQ
jgi:hypothetical protein